MTTREFYTQVIALHQEDDIIRDKATELLNALDTKNGKRAEKVKAKADLENAPLLAKVDEYMHSHKVVVASEVACAIGVSTPKATALIKKYGETVELTTTEVKGKSGKVKGYSLA